MERIGGPEQNFNEGEPLREELREIEERIDKMHREGRGNPEGMGVTESAEVPNKWMDLLEYGAETLELNEEESAKLDDLMQRLLKGELNKEEMDKVLGYMARFEEKRSESETKH